MKHEHHTITEVVDPVCGMTIAPEGAAGRLEYKGATYYFCNLSCLQKFKAAPEQYIQPRREAAPAAGGKVEYTCPMHPEIVRSEPGSCPICGMALEPREITGEEANPELVQMTRRFWASVALTVPILAFMISDLLPGDPLMHTLGMRLARWIQFALATAVVLWGGWPFFERAW